MQILSRAKPAIESSSQPTTSSDFTNQRDEFDEFLLKRDYVGAMTLLEASFSIHFHLRNCKNNLNFSLKIGKTRMKLLLKSGWHTVLFIVVITRRH